MRGKFWRVWSSHRSPPTVFSLRVLILLKFFYASCQNYYDLKIQFWFAQITGTMYEHASSLMKISFAKESTTGKLFHDVSCLALWVNNEVGIHPPPYASKPQVHHTLKPLATNLEPIESLSFRAHRAVQFTMKRKDNLSSKRLGCLNFYGHLSKAIKQRQEWWKEFCKILGGWAASHIFLPYVPKYYVNYWLPSKILP